LWWLSHRLYLLARQFVADDFWRKNINANCHNKVLLDSSVFASGNAFPIRDDLQATFSWAITGALDIGGYARLRGAAQSEAHATSNRKHRDLCVCALELSVRSL
jgi:hypothetical protein